MRYGSVCSGIEAASCAWESLGWQAAWLSEIAPWPSKFLAQRFPLVPNHGSLVGLAGRLAGDARRIDVLVGGTPCQAFSVSGLRGGLTDDRGNLTLEFARLAAALRPRLQGFPDDWTAIDGAKDTPRYAALGNSMAVPCMVWLGRRIELVDGILRGVA